MRPAPPAAAPLRAVTWLAPGLPAGLFEGVCAHLAARLGRPVELTCETRHSGPMGGDRDPFAEGAADLGFLCAPSYLYLRDRTAPAIELVPAGFVFDDPRHGGRPEFRSDVVVRADDAARDVRDLEGRRFGFNDRCSLSGYFAVRQHLAAEGEGERFFGAAVCTGSHHASLEAVLTGAVDGAAIDSNALALWRRARPDAAARLRVVRSLGPFPVQPIVLRAELGPALLEGAASALLDLGPDAGLARYGLAGCAPLRDADFDGERRALEALAAVAR